MKVWRVENSEGKGCYWGMDKPIKKWIAYKHNKNTIKYPLPIEDKGIERKPIKIEICAFKNKQQGLDWFSKYELKKLKKEGFELKETEVKEITLIGEKQVLCIR